MSGRQRVVVGVLGLLVLVTLLLVRFPANWVAQWIAAQSGGRIVLGDAQGTAWDGSAVLGFGDGRGASAALPGRLHWSLGLDGPLTLRLDLANVAVLDNPVSLRLARHGLAVDGGAARVPLSLASLGPAPLNTLRPEGVARLRWDALDLRNGRFEGQGVADLGRLAFALSPVRPLGDYRIEWKADQAGLRWSLSTRQGVLQLDGQGGWRAGGGPYFAGRAATAATASFEQTRQLGPLLDVLGRRDGSAVLIRLGAMAPSM